MKIDMESFKKNGYCIVKNVFSLEEINEFRNLAYQTLEKDKKEGKGHQEVSKIKNVFYPKGDIMGKPLSKLLFSDKILEIAGTVLGQKPTYFGDSTYQVGTGDRGFHRDNVDRLTNIGEDWDGDYDIIRVAVYMQDHDQYSGGLKVIEGSHIGRGNKRKFIDSKAGDVVFWNLRIFHSGNGVRLKLFPNLVMGYRLENNMPKFLIKDSEQERISCFFSFANEGSHLDRYINKYMKVKLLDHFKGFSNDKPSPEIAKKNVKILNVESFLDS
tara:strand:+ start:3687 stop:4496 length:810 start_codon:yes stop_codon:yes gene_type:complete